MHCIVNLVKRVHFSSKVNFPSNYIFKNTIFFNKRDFRKNANKYGTGIGCDSLKIETSLQHETSDIQEANSQGLLAAQTAHR